MDALGREFDHALALQHVRLFVEHHQLAGPGLGPVPAERQDQVLAVSALHRNREVVVDAFFQFVQHGQSVRGGQGVDRVEVMIDIGPPLRCTRHRPGVSTARAYDCQNVGMLLDATMRHGVRDRLGAFAVRRLAVGTRRAAAVALALVEEGHGAALSGMPAPSEWSRHAAVLLTRRAPALSSHGGQWALPGGRIDPGETPEAAALREMSEEVGLALGAGDILGTLDDYATRSGFVITPVVVWGGSARTLQPSPAEVASVHRIPVTEFLRADAPLLDLSEEPGREVLRMPVGDTWIAAPTAAILYQFSEVCIRGHGTRVAHFDQPGFARR